MKEETKFLIEIADRFDDDAQDVLDFVAKSGNLEKAAKALAGAGMPTIPAAAPAPAGTPAAVPGISSVAPEALDKIPTASTSSPEAPRARSTPRPTPSTTPA